MSIQKIKKIIFDHIPIEIWLAHEALGVYMVIAEAADHLNRSSYRQLFGVIQSQALGAFVLSLCKIFEEPNQRYPNYSIPSALKYLRDNLASVTLPTQSVSTLHDFICIEIDPIFDIFDPGKAGMTSDLVCSYFEKKCPRMPPPPRAGRRLDVILHALKVLRDKRIAHHEDHDLKGLTQTDLHGAVELLCFAQTFSNVVSCFFGFRQKLVAQPDEFAPDKSESGAQMRKMIQKIEQEDSH